MNQTPIFECLCGTRYELKPHPEIVLCDECGVYYVVTPSPKVPDGAEEER